MTSDWCTKQHNEQRKLFHRLSFFLSILLISSPHICALLKKVLKTIFGGNWFITVNIWEFTSKMHFCVKLKQRIWFENYQLHSLGETIKGRNKLPVKAVNETFTSLAGAVTFWGDALAWQAISIDLWKEFQSN